MSVNGTWTNGSSNNYSNNSVGPHGWSNISVYAFNSSGTMNATAVSSTTRVANNPVTISNVSGSYTFTAGDTLSVYPASSDPDSDTPTFARNFTNGTFYTGNGTLLFTTTSSDTGIHSWQINVTDGYGSVSSANFTVTVSAVPTPTPTPPPPVTPVLTTITVSPATASVVVGNTQSFTASPKDQFGNPIAAIVTWSSSNTSVGTITSSGLFTAIAPGMTAITATSGNVSGISIVTVTISTDTTPTLLIVTQPIDKQVFITS